MESVRRTRKMKKQEKCLKRNKERKGLIKSFIKLFPAVIRFLPREIDQDSSFSPKRIFRSSSSYL